MFCLPQNYRINYFKKIGKIKIKLKLNLAQKIGNITYFWKNVKSRHSFALHGQLEIYYND